jgi:hypothetical protein
MIEIRQKKKHVDTQSCFETASYLQLIVLPMELVGISWFGCFRLASWKPSDL